MDASPRSEVSTGYPANPPLPPPSTARPAPVVRYLCILLVGLSGTVISIHPASSKA